MDSEGASPDIKRPTTYKEQVELFRGRGMYIESSATAEEKLQRINYYRLTAYALTLKDPYDKDKYLKTSSFNQMLSLYEFDQRLRSLLLGVLETIEIAVRTHISYEIAHKFGPLGYKDKENFINEEFHSDAIEELEKQTKKSSRSELFIQHHYHKYGGHLPIWVAMEITSFGYLSKFYGNLNEEIKKHIAKTYYNIPYRYLESWLQTLSNVRNTCAHYGRFYGKKLTYPPRLFKEELKQINKSRIFAAIYIIQRLLTKVEGNRLILDLDALIQRYEESIEFNYIGFPVNWKELLIEQNNKSVY